MMKKVFCLVLAVLLLVPLFPALPVAAASGELTVYPEYPEDALERDYMYEVYIEQDGERYRLPVYNDMRHANHYQNGANQLDTGDMNRRFCEFAFDGSVTVEIRVNTNMSNFALLPSSEKIASTVSGNTVRFTVDKPGQWVFRINEDDETLLSIFGDPLETDAPDPAKSTYRLTNFNKTSTYNIVVFDENNPAPKSIQKRLEGSYYNMEAGTKTYGSKTLLYFAPGVHDVDHLGLLSDQAVYLAPGAILNTRIHVYNSTSYTQIFGRGILRDGNDTRAYNSGDFFNYQLTVGAHWEAAGWAQYNTVKDIKLLDSKSFCTVYLTAKNCLMDNVKTIANEISTDGISYWGGSQNITVKNSYLYVCDNLFVVGSGAAVSNLTVDNCVLGTSIALFFPQATLGDNIVFSNLDVFRCGGAVFESASGHSGGTMTINNMSMIDCLATGTFITLRNVGGGNNNLKKVVMKNVALPGSSARINTNRDYTGSFGNLDVSIQNLYIGGTAATFDTTKSTASTSQISFSPATGSGTASKVVITKAGGYTAPTYTRKSASYTAPKVNIGTTAASHTAVPLYGQEAAFVSGSTLFIDAASLLERFGFETHVENGVVTASDAVVQFTLSADGCTKNGQAVAVTAQLKNGRVMLPHTALHTLLSLQTTYNSSTKTLTVQNYNRVTENLIENGDFENPRALESWTCYDFTPLYYTTNDTHNGKGALLMEPVSRFSNDSDSVVDTSGNATRWRAGYQLVTDIIRQNGAGTYTLTFWAKCADSTVSSNAYVSATLVGGYSTTDSAANRQQKLTKNWKQYQMTFLVNDGSTVTGGSAHTSWDRIQLGLCYIGANRVLFDDIVLTKTGYSTHNSTSQKTLTLSDDTLAYGETATVTVSDTAAYTFYTTSDYLTVAKTANNKATLSVNYLAPVERQAVVYAQNSSGVIVGEAFVVIPADDSPYTPGDVNRDGKVSVADCVALVRYLVGGYDVYIDRRAANVNGDTVMNVADAVQIARYLAGGYNAELKEEAPPYVPKTIQLIVQADGTCVLPQGVRVYIGDTLIIPRSQITYTGDFVNQSTKETEYGVTVYPNDYVIEKDGTRLGNCWSDTLVVSDVMGGSGGWKENGATMAVPGTYTLRATKARNAQWTQYYTINQEIITFQVYEP